MNELIIQGFVDEMQKLAISKAMAARAASEADEALDTLFLKAEKLSGGDVRKALQQNPELKKQVSMRARQSQNFARYAGSGKKAVIKPKAWNAAVRVREAK